MALESVCGFKKPYLFDRYNVKHALDSDYLCMLKSTFLLPPRTDVSCERKYGNLRNKSSLKMCIATLYIDFCSVLVKCCIVYCILPFFNYRLT